MNYIHESNFRTKISQNYNHVGDKIEEFYTNTYLPVKMALIEIDFSKDDDETFIKATEIINNYYKELDRFCNKYNIMSQSKFRSTFLEELSLYFFSDNELVKKGILGFYNKGIYAGMKIDSDMKVNIMKKDVDFCIGKKIRLSVDNNVEEIILPLVAVEIKTYLDATMFNEVKYSSRQIKNATPNAKTYVLMETNEVGSDKVIAARYESNLDEMFVLRFDTSYPIVWEVLKDYYEEIENDIKNIQVQRTVVVPGRLIHIEEEE